MDEIEKIVNGGGKEAERAERIFNEFVNTRKRLEDEKIKNTIVMFGSARINPDDTSENGAFGRHYYNACRELARRLAEWSKNEFKNLPPEDKFYICSGGGGGIMEAANRGASDAGEKTLGFNILLPFEQEVNPYVSKELDISFHYFFIRKFWFAYLAKAFVIFPGGFGTMDELFEIITLAQTNKMQKTMPFVIFGKKFFEKVLNFDMLFEYGFISEKDKELYIITDDIDEAFNHITKNITEKRLLLDYLHLK